MSIEKLSTGQYAKKAGCSRQNVRYYLKNGMTLPGVEKVEEIAGRTILHTDLQKLLKNKFKKVA